MKTAGWLFLLLSFASFAQAKHHTRQWWVMATPLRIEIDDAGLSQEDLDALFARCHQRVVDLDELLNIWIDESPLKSVNRAGGVAVPIGSDLATFIVRSRKDHERTLGAFDPSVGTWRGLEPGAERVDIGMNRVLVAREHDQWYVQMPKGFALDPGGNAKGMAVDAIVDELRAAGVNSAFVDFGSSSMFGLGRDASGNAWRVAVSGIDGTILGSVELSDHALSVSKSWSEDLGDGSRRAHIFDPRTKKLIESERLAIVLSPSALDAEVLSTALIVSKDIEILEHYDGARGVVLEGEEGIPELDWLKRLQ